MKAFAAESHSLLKRLMAAIPIAAACALPSMAHADTSSIIVRFEPIVAKGRNAFHVVETFRARQPETEIVVPTH